MRNEHEMLRDGGEVIRVRTTRRFWRHWHGDKELMLCLGYRVRRCAAAGGRG